MGKVIYLQNNIKKINKMKTKVSSSYTVKAFVKNVKRLKEQGLLNAENSVVLDDIVKDVKEEWLIREFK
jgi:hypothetical protein